MQAKVLFARIGSMTYYAGPQPSDPRPVGGGAYNKQRRGSELFNFKIIEDPGHRKILYGWVRPPKIGGRRLNLKRIDPTCKQDILAGVTVIFVAGQKIIGWYKNATLFRDSRHESTGQRVWTEADGPHSALYNMTAAAKDAVLLPTNARTYQVPRGRSGFGQANVRYTHDSSLKPDLRNWMQSAIEYVDGYAGENLLANQAAEAAAKVTEALERSAGYQSDPAIRTAVEEHAMKRVEKEYSRNGYTVWNTSKSRPYDLLCEKGGEKVYVEVKGTQTSGDTISLTYNEVEFAGDRRARVDLCIVHSIGITDPKRPKAKGGVLVKYPSWNPKEHRLRPINYLCHLKPAAKK